MTEEQAYWMRAESDYNKALQISQSAWGDSGTPEAIQAGAATVLIHMTRLRENGVLDPVTPALTKFTPVLTSAPKVQDGRSCPKCGGEMEPNRNKKSPKAPDWLCMQKEGECGTTKEVNGKVYFNATGKWDK